MYRKKLKGGVTIIYAEDVYDIKSLPMYFLCSSRIALPSNPMRRRTNRTKAIYFAGISCAMYSSLVVSFPSITQYHNINAKHMFHVRKLGAERYQNMHIVAAEFGFSLCTRVEYTSSRIRYNSKVFETRAVEN